MKKEVILIYDSSCPFCTGLAKVLKRSFGVSIQPNHRCRIRGIQAAIKKDVHLVIKQGRGMMVYSGADAAAKVLSYKYNFIWNLYSFPPCRLVFRCFYFVLKKSRKYLL